MPVAFISHPACRRHQMGDGHPEQPARLDAIEELLHVRQLHDFLVHHEAPRATVEQLIRVHPRAHVERLGALSPAEGLVRVDPDTGDFSPADGMGALVDTDAAFAKDFGNGPE